MIWRFGYFCGACKAFGKLMFIVDLWIVFILWISGNLDEAVLLAAFCLGVVVVLSALATACVEPSEEGQDVERD